MTSGLFLFPVSQEIGVGMGSLSIYFSITSISASVHFLLSAVVFYDIHHWNWSFYTAYSNLWISAGI